MTQELNEQLAYLLQEAKKVEMSPEEIAEQRMSFAFGNSAFENPDITKEIVASEARKLAF